MGDTISVPLLVMLSFFSIYPNIHDEDPSNLSQHLLSAKSILAPYHTHQHKLLMDSREYIFLSH
jgi:hypothetical protein